MTQPYVTLCVARQEAITLADALVACKEVLTAACAIVYGMDSCQLARVSGNGELEYSARKTAPSCVFEARAFCTAGELRWVADSDTLDPQNSQQAIGTAVFVSESSVPENWTRMTDVPNLIPHPNQYMLWGNVASGDDVWVELYEYRVESLYVPVNGVRDGDRIKIDAIEYIGADDDFGNMAVQAERLTGLSNLIEPAAAEVKHG